MEQRIIRTKYHGIADYITGLFLIATPWLFGFAENPNPKWIALLAGGSILLLSLCTKYEVGFIPIIPMKLHLQLDIATGFFLLLSPWLFSFSGIAAWIFILVGLVELFAGFFTHTMPYYTNEKVT